MKKNIFLVLVLVAVLFTVAGCDKSDSNKNATNNNNSNTAVTNNDTTNTNSQYIGEDAAKGNALKDAGLTAADVTELTAELDTENGKAVYDVDFKHDGKEYNYDVDAITGDVVEKNSEIDD